MSKYLLSSKLALFCLLLLLVFFGQAKFRQWRRERDIETEKKSLGQQQQLYAKKNQELSDSLQYLTSPDFRESVAREQFNLKKPGELVYNFSPSLATAARPSLAPAPQQQSNPRKWWDYFFGAR